MLRSYWHVYDSFQWFYSKEFLAIEPHPQQRCGTGCKRHIVKGSLRVQRDLFVLLCMSDAYRSTVFEGYGQNTMRVAYYE
jgi:hypothetical protein